ncbi:MAG: hypothetical protein FVQ79_01835 [Planctomycetes bacterium]|nr:hypothetical protein [Planctomycetota bacterium]
MTPNQEPLSPSGQNSIETGSLQDPDDFSLLDIILVIFRNRKIVVLSAGVFVVIGLLLAILGTPMYTASTHVIRESASADLSQGLPLAALRGLGISFGGGSIGLSEDTFPDILKSREVGLTVVRTPFYFPDLDSTMTLVEYDHHPGGIFGYLIMGLRAITIDLPGHILRAIRGSPEEQMASISGEAVDFPTLEEEESIRYLRKKTVVAVDRKSGIMTIKVTTHHPVLSVEIVEALVLELTDRVRSIYTLKARENLDFLEARLSDVSVDLQLAEENLAHFLDSNQDLRTAQLRTQMDRLQRQVDFKTQLYTELQTQVMQAKIELQRSKPVITIIEKPVPPHEISAPRRKLIVIISLFLGLGFGVGIALMKNFGSVLEKDIKTQAKWAELKSIIAPLQRRSARWLRPFTRPSD